jgi:hypothetical protein
MQTTCTHHNYATPPHTHLQFVNELSTIVRRDSSASHSRDPQLTLDHDATTPPLPSATEMFEKWLRVMKVIVSAQDSSPPRRLFTGGDNASPEAVTSTTATDCLHAHDGSNQPQQPQTAQLAT